jgi:hypothetical protein
MELPDFRGESFDLLTHFVDAHHPNGCSQITLGSPKIAVPSGAIIEIIDLIRDIRQFDLTLGADAVLDVLLFQTAKERLHYGITQQLPFRLTRSSR